MIRIDTQIMAFFNIYEVHLIFNFDMAKPNIFAIYIFAPRISHECIIQIHTQILVEFPIYEIH